MHYEHDRLSGAWLRNGGVVAYSLRGRFGRISNMKNEDCIKVHNKLLRGELSAIETYAKAIEKYPNSSAIPELRRIQSEHRQSANTLTANIREMGGVPDTDSGAWGTFANAVQSASNLFGEGSAIESLQRGEEHGKNDFEAALEDDDVMDTHKTTIRNELLPRVKEHIVTLEGLEELVD